MCVYLYIYILNIYILQINKTKTVILDVINR